MKNNTKEENVEDRNLTTHGSDGRHDAKKKWGFTERSFTLFPIARFSFLPAPYSLFSSTPLVI